MLKRKFYNTLLSWKNSKKNECLLIKGARQVGKTYLVRELGKSEYESFIEINFYANPELKVIFEGSLSAEEILKRISANIPNIKIIPNKTLLFLDEIQRCSRARTALKFLAEDKRIDVIASGSLLGLSYGQDSDKAVEQIDSVPVGYERQVVMYSMDFEEFLWANGYGEDAISYLREFYLNREKVPNEINDKYESLLREYLVVGGMPEVVADFVENKNFDNVQQLQEKIIHSYEDDILNHANAVEKVKVRKCFDSIPKQLARENKKFKFGEVEKGSSARKYMDSIEWLHNANLAYICCNLYEPVLPLKFNDKENEFKVYMHDTGLLLAMYGFATKKALLNNTLIGNAKGGIYENFVAGALIKNGYNLHYYKPDDSNELEFIIEFEDGVAPIEVKAGNTASKSLNNFISKFNPNIAFKFISGNVGFVDKKLSLPHYMLMFI